ncbi:MAG: hypothetical protein WA347_03060 [Rhabdochlamydiaceae bacterium]|jgi:hypothetical protein
MTAEVLLPQILIRNSFNILGLSSSSALKEIRKRSQQLLQLAKIEEVQEFDIDIGHVKEFRNEGEIRLALERVSGIQDRLKEIFFWFEDHRIESRKALELISKGSYQKAIAIFEASDSDWLDKKNLGLVLMFHAFASSDLDSFCHSLDLWKLIAESDNFWKFYEKHYLLHDELGTSRSFFEEFRNSLFETLSAKAVSFYHQTKHPESIGACYSAFGRIGRTADSEILQPLILKVKKEMEELENMRDADPDASSVKKILKKVYKCFSALDKFELSEYSPLTILKNDTAEKLRSIAVDIYNESVDTETALLLLDQSSKLAVSEDLLDKIESDKKQLKKNEAWQSVAKRFSHVSDLIEGQKLEEANRAYLQLDSDLAIEAAESSANNRIQLLINYTSSIMQKGHELFEKRKFGIETLAISALLNIQTQKDAILAFEHARETLQSRLHLLDFLDSADRETLLKTLDSISADLRQCEFASLVDRHQSYLKTIESAANEQPEENTQTAVRLLGIAVCFSIFYRRFRGLFQKKMWKWIGWTAAILFYFYFFVIIDNDKPASNKSYKNSNYQTKSSSSSSFGLTSQEKEAIEWLDILYEDGLKSLRDKGYSDRQIAQALLKETKEAGYSDVSDYLIDLEENS